MNQRGGNSVEDDDFEMRVPLPNVSGVLYDKAVDDLLGRTWPTSISSTSRGTERLLLPYTISSMAP